jgi:hypothetical protein
MCKPDYEAILLDLGMSRFSIDGLKDHYPREWEKIVAAVQTLLSAGCKLHKRTEAKQ